MVTPLLICGRSLGSVRHGPREGPIRGDIGLAQAVFESCHATPPVNETQESLLCSAAAWTSGLHRYVG